MSLDFSIEYFKNLYCDRLLSKEEIFRELNITDYTYKKIIKEFNLNRCKTNKINRFKAKNNIEVIKKEDDDVKTKKNIEVEKKVQNEREETLDTSEKKEVKEDLLEKVKKSLETSKRNRMIKKY